MIQRSFALVAVLLFTLVLTACDTTPPEIKGVTHIDNTQLATLLEDDTLLIDIRLREEWRETGVIKGSKMITLFNQQGKVAPDFVPRLQRLAKPDQPVALICRTGNRTLAAARMLTEQLGYSQIYNVTDGISRWIKDQRPVVGMTR